MKIGSRRILEMIWNHEEYDENNDIFKAGRNDMIEYVIWKLIVETLDVPNNHKKRRGIVLNIVRKELDKWVNK